MLSVNRNFYYFGIFFLALQLFLNAFHGAVYLENGIGTRYLESFPVWFLLVQTVSFIALLILARYYWYKKYWATLISALFFAVASLYFTIVFYYMFTEQRLEGRYVSAYNVLLLTSLLYGASLFISQTRKRVWLSIAGVFSFTLSASLIVCFVWILGSHDFELKRMLNKIHDGIAIVGSLAPLPFIFNFHRELKSLSTEKTAIPLSKTPKFFLAIILIIAMIPTIRLALDSMDGTFHKNDPSEQAKKTARPFEARTFVSKTGKALPYRLLKPLDYDPEKEYPLAICLHHGGGNGTENVVQVQMSDWAQTLADSVNRKRYPAFIFVPQCPPGSSFGGIPHYPEISDVVFEAIADLEKEFAIDRKRRYVMGVSLGGFGSWHFIGTRPELIAAAIPVCGGGNTDHISNMVDIPIWAFHGEKDTNVPVGLSRVMIEGIQDAGGNPKYTEFQNKGHGIWQEVSETPGTLEWLFAQEKN